MINGLANSKEVIEVFYIDYHQPTIDILRQSMNEKTGDINIIGDANSVEEALPQLKISTAKIILLGIRSNFNSGVYSCKLIKNQYPDKKVIVLSTIYYPYHQFTPWINIADTILNRFTSLNEIKAVIKAINAGQKVIGHGVPIPKNEDTILNCTTSEQRVLKAFAMGFSKEEASRILGSSTYAVNFHCKNLLHKFNKEKLYQVIEKAKQEGLLAFEI